MNRVWLLVLGIALGVGASWLWRMQDVKLPAPTSAGQAVDDEDAAPATTASATPAHLHLDAAARELADIQSRPITATSIDVEQQTAGRVLDGGELQAALRERRTARSALKAQQDLLATQRARLARLQGFAARGEITVTRELNALQLSVQREADVATNRAAQLAQSEAALRARWGAELAGTDGLEATLAEGAAQLVEFAAEIAPSAIFVASDEQRDKASSARVLGAIPMALGAAPLATWVALCSDARLRIGMRVSVWIPAQGKTVSGALLPAAAVVWHGGAQWFYVETAPGDFERRRLPASVSDARGIIVSEGLSAGTPVVVRGAQALLAEELRQRIPSEDDD